MSRFRVALNIFLIYALALLPLSINRRIGAALGWLTYRMNGRDAQITRKNIALCFPQLSATEQEQLVKQSLLQTGTLVTETCFVIRRDFGTIRNLILNIEGEHLVRAALARGKGLIILAPHLGNWEVLGQHLTTFGEVTNLYQPPKMAALDELIKAGREKSGAQLVPTNAKGVAALLKTLKNNGISGILPDQNPNDEASGIYVPFFGHPAFTMVLANKLIQRTDCIALFAFAKRVDGGFHLFFREPPADIYHTYQTVSVGALNRGVESLVLEAPTQYQWEYKRFKKTQTGQTKYY